MRPVLATPTQLDTGQIYMYPSFTTEGRLQQAGCEPIQESYAPISPRVPEDSEPRSSLDGNTVDSGDESDNKNLESQEPSESAITLGALHDNENGITSALIERMAQRPSRPSDRLRLEALLAELRSVARLRMSALRRRSTAKERSAQMRILHHHLLQQIHRMVQLLGERLPVERDESAADWDDCLIDIKDYVVESGKTGKEFDDEQKRLIDLEWDMCAMENNLYGQFEPQGGGGIDDSGNASTNDQSVAADIVAEMARLLSPTMGPTRQGRSHSPPEALSDDPYAGVPSFAILSSDNHNTHSAESGLSAFGQRSSEGIGDQFGRGAEALQDPSQHVFGQMSENILADGSQFWDEEVELLIEEARKELLEKSPGVIDPFERNLQILPRWLSYGTPWNGELLDKERQARPLIATSKAIRALLWHTLAVLCSGLPASASIAPLKDLHSFADVKDLLVGTWMWDPWTLDDIPNGHRNAYQAEPSRSQNAASEAKVATALPGKPCDEKTGDHEDGSTALSPQPSQQPDTLEGVQIFDMRDRTRMEQVALPCSPIISPLRAPSSEPALEAYSGDVVSLERSDQQLRSRSEP
ncbi:hypothetical protein PMZ80_002808 [Knufia obscura]|uniref:Uncharacterized protein n=1 Tax=Knufia obscura TaxID=1635080 RepID=A0ABR0RZF7_9EURO|nr:hypothetical protein PMZ80_002808 [Knufia obscura]